MAKAPGRITVLHPLHLFDTPAQLTAITPTQIQRGTLVPSTRLSGWKVRLGLAPSLPIFPLAISGKYRTILSVIAGPADEGCPGGRVNCPPCSVPVRRETDALGRPVEMTDFIKHFSFTTCKSLYPGSVR